MGKTENTIYKTVNLGIKTKPVDAYAVIEDFVFVAIPVLVYQTQKADIYRCIGSSRDSWYGCNGKFAAFAFVYGLVYLTQKPAI